MSNPYSSQYAGYLMMDEPIEVLKDKLSSKSTELYLFWQNYSQLYNLLQQKAYEVLKLKQEVHTLKTQQKFQPRPQHQPKVQAFQDTFIKERYLNLQKNFDDLKLQNQRLKIQIKELKKQNSKIYEQNLQLQTLLQQLREQNILQKQSIQKILDQLKATQAELSSYSKLYEQTEQKQFQIVKLRQNEKKLNEIIAEREEEIDELIEAEKQTKIVYENLLRESMQNAKIKVIESLPNLIKTSKQRVQIVTN